MAYIYTPFMKKVLHITKRKRKTNVQHDSQADDLRARFKVPEWGVFCHTERLRDHPARLNLVLSDSTNLELNTGLAFILLLLVLDMKGNGLTANKQDQQRFRIKTATGMKAHNINAT